MEEFNIGDEIIINENGKIYSWTKEGSIGIITKIVFGQYYVTFSKTTGHSGSLRTGPFEISVSCMELLNGNNKGKTRIERKINTMFRRQPYYQTLGEQA